MSLLFIKENTINSIKENGVNATNIIVDINLHLKMPQYIIQAGQPMSIGNPKGLPGQKVDVEQLGKLIFQISSYAVSKS